jgi:hypothetical protein
LRPLAHIAFASGLERGFDAGRLPTDVEKLAGRLVRKRWNNHGLPEASRRLRGEPDAVSFVSEFSCVVLISTISEYCDFMLQPEITAAGEGDQGEGIETHAEDAGAEMPSAGAHG